MRKESKISILFLGISVLVPVLFMMIFLSDNRKIERIDLDNAEEITSVEGYSIDAADIIDGNIYINGWFLETLDSLENVNRTFILSDSKNIYKMNTVMEVRSDVTSLKNTGLNYNNCGLTGNGLAEGLSTGEYQIGILVYSDKLEHYFFTDKYLEVFGYE